MKTQWIKHRDVVAAFYRAANAYSALCRKEYLSSANLNSVEIQILEQLMEHAEENHNMKWFAQELGISNSAFTNYVNKLTKRGFVEKFHAADNKKNIILRVTDSGVDTYEEYAHVMKVIFEPIFEELDKISAADIDHLTKLLRIWGDQHIIGTAPDANLSLIPIKK